MSYALLVDYTYCTGCHSCEIACNQEYQRALGLSGIKVFESTMVQGDRYYIDYIPVRTDLCTFCAGRLKKGKKPACVQHCLSGCLEIVDRQEITDRLTEVKRKQMFFL
jgi:Fe-S-cluster-containing dehydrogenase component